MPTTFDENELLSRVDNDRAFLGETVEMLAQDGRALLADVRSAVAAGDAAAVGRAAHALKGMISNFCAPTAHASARTCGTPACGPRSPPNAWASSCGAVR